jgi:uncharacterized membrane protein
MYRRPRLPAWRREALRTTLWVVPTLEVLAVAVLFAITYALDQRSYHGELDLPAWVNNGSADAARQILIGIAAAVITVVGLVFSITIVALTLASTQFGPRILRNFVRDFGTQFTLGTFVATFVYSVLALGSIAHGARGDFVPHLSITVTIGLVLVDLGVLIYFINHVAKSIQLPEVIASIARDLSKAIDLQLGARNTGVADQEQEAGPSPTELLFRLKESGAVVPATRSGYLQFVGYDELVGIAASADAVVQLFYLPGHFVVEGLPLALVWPSEAAGEVASALDRAHVSGPQRTLAQDLTFAIDQLVEIAIRALSPAVNDTFTALTCIDWLSAALCRVSQRTGPIVNHRDRTNHVRVIAREARYERLVGRAFDKVRQAARGMPAVMIRQLEALAKIMAYTTTQSQRDALRAQAAMIYNSSMESVPEESDRLDVQHRYDAVVLAAGRWPDDRPSLTQAPRPT